MARKIRVEFEGAVYHVMCRGDRREKIFEDDEDRRLFLATVGEACERTGWRLHAYVLMGNHYHWLLETPRANLVRGMQWFQTTYTTRYNHRHRLSGHLFQGRYKAVLVDPQAGNCFVTVSDYIHLNPARAGLIGKKGALAEYAWSSLPYYGLGAARRPRWLAVERVMGELNWRDRPRDRAAYLRRMEAGAREDQENEDFAKLRRGWILGDDAFREEIQDRIAELLGGHRKRKLRTAEVDSDYGELRAKRILADGLRVFDLEEEALKELPKSDWRKRVIGHVIRRNTTQSLQWIGDRLHMGVESRVSRLCARVDDLGNRGEQARKTIERMSKSKD